MTGQTKTSMAGRPALPPKPSTAGLSARALLAADASLLHGLQDGRFGKASALPAWAIPTETTLHALLESGSIQGRVFLSGDQPLAALTWLARGERRRLGPPLRSPHPLALRMLTVMAEQLLQEGGPERAARTSCVVSPQALAELQALMRGGFWPGRLLQLVSRSIRQSDSPRPAPGLELHRRAEGVDGLPEAQWLSEVFSGGALFRGSLRHGRSSTWQVTDAEGTAAVVQSRLIPAGAAQVELLAVRSGPRARELVELLLDAVEREAAAEGCTRLVASLPLSQPELGPVLRAGRFVPFAQWVELWGTEEAARRTSPHWLAEGSP